MCSLKKTFLLGFGAQKAGTTWLHTELSRSDSVDFGWTKEYHFLDSHTVASCRPFILHKYQNLNRIINQNDPVDCIKTLKRHKFLIKSLAFHADPDCYFDYFSTRFRGNISLTGDLTPSNALISEATIGWVRSEFLSRDIRCAALLVLRDPVERFWSAIRMIRRKQPERWAHISEDDHLLMSLNREDFYQRGAYADIIKNIKSSFPESDTSIVLYEELTQHEHVFHGLCDFLGLSPFSPRLDVRENSSPKNASIRDETIRLLAERHETSYQAAIDVFGQDKIRKNWPSIGYLEGSQ